MKFTATVESVGAQMIDVSVIGDVVKDSGGRFIKGERHVDFRTRAGSFRMPWALDVEMPLVGERFTIEVLPEVAPR